MVKINSKTSQTAKRGLVSTQIANVLALLVLCYQYAISPLLGPRCRFYPSCSEYARQALIAHGLFAGATLALKRVLKCHPGHAGGVDPVPDSPEIQHSTARCHCDANSDLSKSTSH